jgi:PAS domain S-box-containing protein
VRADGTILALNDTAAKRFGKSAQEAVGRNLAELLEPEVLAERKLQAAPALRDGTPVLFEDQRRGRTFRTSVYPIKDGAGKVVQLAVFGTDITAYKKAEERLLAHQNNLRSLASQLSLAEERQRRRIAVEVHDQIGHNLAFAKMKLRELDRQTAMQGVSALTEEISGFIDRAIQDTRALVSELGSPVLYELGFVPAVSGLCKEIGRGHGLDVRYEDDKRPKPLADDVRVLLFQSLREVLANVLKHARANRVDVSLSVKGEFLEVCVCDDGVGFDPAGLHEMIQEGESFGLFSIQQRLESLAGHIRIESAPGSGTCITLTAPLTTAPVPKGNRKQEENESP